MYEKVIVGVDGPEGGRDALWLARQLAGAGARFTLARVEVVPREPWPPSGAMTEAAHASRALGGLAQLREEARVDADLVHVEAASVAAGLHELAARRDGDVLVVGASRRDGYERTLVGDDVRDVLDSPPCAVAIAPRGHAQRAPALRRIGVAYDGSVRSEGALALARGLARERHAVLSAFQAVPEPYVSSIVNPQPEIEAGLAETRKRIAGLGDVEAHAESSDDAAEALARYGASVDLLVLGSHEYRPIDRVGPGSTAQRLAEDTPCPLLVLSRDPADV